MLSQCNSTPPSPASQYGKITLTLRHLDIGELHCGFITNILKWFQKMLENYSHFKQLITWSIVLIKTVECIQNFPLKCFSLVQGPGKLFFLIIVIIKGSNIAIIAQWEFCFSSQQSWQTTEMQPVQCFWCNLHHAEIVFRQCHWQKHITLALQTSKGAIIICLHIIILMLIGRLAKFDKPQIP